MESFYTVGQLAQQTKSPIWKIQYLLRSHDIREIGRAGNMRMFSPDVVEILRRELKQIKKRRRAS